MRAVSDSAMLTFRCNICGSQCEAQRSELSREAPSCATCGSTVRMRSLIYMLTKELFGRPMAIDDIDPPRPDIEGIGMSCWDGYALRLPHRVKFTNTYYHQAPFLDITDIKPEQHGTLDFIISSDVFEHVQAPVQRAFDNARRMLKPGGVLVFSVPWFPAHWWKRHSIEHFPELHDFKIAEEGGKWILHNVTAAGVEQRFDDLIFHGGPGSTLEMRVFSRWALIRHLKRAGFVDITFHDKDVPEFGLHWPHAWSTPLTARAPSRKWLLGNRRTVGER